MGISGIRSVALRSCVIAQESTVHQGSTEYVLADVVGILKEFCLLGRVCDDL